MRRGESISRYRSGMKFKRNIMATSLIAISEDMTKEQLIEIGLDLQKQFRSADAAHRKEKALLEQRLELLQMQIEEGKVREESMKKMYESMLNALDSSGIEDEKRRKETALTKELHEKELAELKQLHTEVAAVLKGQINDLRSTLSQCEDELKITKKQNAALEQNCKAKTFECEELEAKLLKADAERKKLEENIESSAEERDERLIVDKAKNMHSEELERVKKQYNETINEIMSIYEREKSAMELRLERANSEINELKSYKERYKKNESLERMQEGYLAQIKLLSEQLEEFKQNESEECKQYVTNKDNYSDIDSSLDKHNTQLDNTNKDCVEEKKELACRFLNIEQVLKEMKINKAHSKSDNPLKGELKSLVSKLNSAKTKLIQTIREPYNLENEEKILAEFKSIFGEESKGVEKQENCSEYKLNTMNAPRPPKMCVRENAVLKESDLKNLIQ
eukprot:TRINITY_DN10774_c0_g3_i6.p1 TRINITY_DN10774_c0_g3~~TRINITY_DN10774_c0_g3_i6.p1  ORF type:complete len:453 (-),score=108.44 TRINITY_DN10774_c0_g3_i6:90-1448(-)